MIGYYMNLNCPGLTTPMALRLVMPGANGSLGSAAGAAEALGAPGSLAPSGFGSGVTGAGTSLTGGVAVTSGLVHGVSGSSRTDGSTGCARLRTGVGTG